MVAVDFELGALAPILSVSSKFSALQRIIQHRSYETLLEQTVVFNLHQCSFNKLVSSFSCIRQEDNLD